MGSIVYNPVTKVAMDSVVAIEKAPTWSENLAKQIGESVKLAVAQSIQENLVIPIKTFIVDSWVIFVHLSEWGSIFGIVIGSTLYIMGDQDKGKKIIAWSVICEIGIQILNYVFLG